MNERDDFIEQMRGLGFTVVTVTPDTTSKDIEAAINEAKMNTKIDDIDDQDRDGFYHPSSPFVPTQAQTQRLRERIKNISDTLRSNTDPAAGIAPLDEQYTPPEQPIFLHVETDELYLLLDEGTIEGSDVPAVFYMSCKTGRKWFRMSHLFFDGRFRPMNEWAGRLYSRMREKLGLN